MPSEERMLRSLEGTLPAEVPGLPLGQINNVTRARIRHSMAELAAGNVEHVQTWLHEVAKTQPAKAIELFIELVQFSLPRVKAVAVDVRSKDGSVSRMSMADLQNVISEQ
jgi:hypothetical protein